MDQERDELLYLGLGVLAAVLLGVALMPLRAFTTASNFTFAFLVLVIVTAEYGGRWAATGTALASALSLDFFLTQPYLRLIIEDKHDIIAFAGLAICGLVAAAFGSQRAARNAALRGARRQLAALHETATALESPSPAPDVGLSARCAGLLDTARGAFLLTAVVLRDADDQVIAASTGGRGPLAPASEPLDRGALSPAAAPWRGAARRWSVPPEGGRIALVAHSHRVGWLDVYGNGATMSASSWHALGDFARLLAAILSRARAGNSTRS